MQSPVILLTALLAFAVPNPSTGCCSWNAPPPHNAIKDRPSADSKQGRLLIDPALAFSCPGTVTKWRLHAKSSSGAVRFQVWRPSGRGMYHLVGENKVNIERNGALEVSVRDSEQIRFQGGDVIGWVVEGFGSLAYEDNDTHYVVVGSTMEGTLMRRYSVGCQLGGVVMSFNGIQWIQLIDISESLEEIIEIKFHGGWGGGILAHAQEGVQHFSVVLTPGDVMVTYNFGKGRGFETVSVEGSFIGTRVWNALTLSRRRNGYVNLTVNGITSVKHVTPDAALQITSFTLGGAFLEEGRFIGHMKEVKWKGHCVAEDVLQQKSGYIVRGAGPLSFRFYGNSIAAVSFLSPTSQLKLPPLRNMSLRFEYRTYEMNALLAYQKLAFPHSYLALFIQNGNLHLEMNTRGRCSRMCLQYARGVNDGLWHSVVMRRAERHFGYISADNSNFSFPSGAVESEGELMLSGNVKDLPQGFLGCFRGVEINDQKVDLIGSVKSQSDIMIGCSSNPSRNVNTCIRGLNQFVCDCEPGYTGTHCSSANVIIQSQPSINPPSSFLTYGSWSAWSPWQPCNQEVCLASQHRSRTCNESVQCLGDAEEAHVCSNFCPRLQSFWIAHPQYVSHVTSPPAWAFQDSIHVSFSTHSLSVFIVALVNMVSDTYLALSVNAEGKIHIQLKSTSGQLIGFLDSFVADGNEQRVDVTRSGSFLSLQMNNSGIKSREADSLSNLTLIHAFSSPLDWFTYLNPFKGCVSRLNVNGIDLMANISQDVCSAEKPQNGTFLPVGNMGTPAAPRTNIDTSLFDPFVVFLIGIGGFVVLIFVVKLIYNLLKSQRAGKYRTEEKNVVDRSSNNGMVKGGGSSRRLPPSYSDSVRRLALASRVSQTSGRRDNFV